jgi:hypothetical protein
MVYCTIGIIAHYGFTALWFCIITIIWQYDIGGKRKADGDVHWEQEKEGWNLGGLMDFA